MNEVLEFVQDNIPYIKKIMPYIIKHGAPYIKENLIQKLKNWLYGELLKVNQGC